MLKLRHKPSEHCFYGNAIKQTKCFARDGQSQQRHGGVDKRTAAGNSQGDVVLQIHIAVFDGQRSRLIATASFQNEDQSYCHLAILNGWAAWFFEPEILGEALSFPMVERLDADLLAIDRQREFSIQFDTEGIWECFSSLAIDRLWERSVLFVIDSTWERSILFDIDRQREFSIQFDTEGIWECFSSFAIDNLWERFILQVVSVDWIFFDI